MCVFFFNDTATTEIYTLSLHDALPISVEKAGTTDSDKVIDALPGIKVPNLTGGTSEMLPNHHITKPVLIGEIQKNGDRKSTRLNSSHANISYAVFCLKKKKNNILHTPP